MPKLIINAILFIALNSLSAQARFQHNGIADNLDGNCYTFRQRSNFTGGSVFSINALDKTKVFYANVRIYPGCLDENGDGVVFVFQPIGPFAGSFTRRLGNRGLSPTLSIELDLDPNTEDNDPDFDHIAIMLNGVQDHLSPQNLAGPVRALNQVDNVEDCDIHFMNIEWSPQSGMLDVYFDCQLRLSKEIRFENYFGDQKIHWGVTVGVKSGGIEYSVCPDHIEELVNEQTIKICKGNTTELEPTRPAIRYNWYSGTELINVGSSKIVVMPITDKSYHLISRDSCGRQYRQNYHVIVEADSLPLNIGPKDTLLCDGTIIELKGNIENAAYLWQDGSRSSSYSVDKAGQYKVIASLGHCTNTDSIEVINEISNLENWKEDIFGCVGETVSLSTGLGRHYAHVWENGQMSNEIVVSESGIYKVHVGSVCEERELQAEVVFSDCTPLYFPNSFSPNDDQINDDYRIATVIQEVQILKWMIVDRWGDVIQDISNYPKGQLPHWSGQLPNGKIAPSGVYVLFVKLALPNGLLRNEVRDITLIR